MTVDERIIEFWKKQVSTTLKHAEEKIRTLLIGVGRLELASKVALDCSTESYRVWLDADCYFAIEPVHNYNGNKYWMCRRYKTPTGWGWRSMADGENLDMVILAGLLSYTNIPGE